MFISEIVRRTKLRTCGKKGRNKTAIAQYGTGFSDLSQEETFDWVDHFAECRKCAAVKQEMEDVVALDAASRA